MDNCTENSTTDVTEPDDPRSRLSHISGNSALMLVMQNILGVLKSM